MGGRCVSSLIGREGFAAGACEPELSSLMSSFSSLPGLKYGTRLAGILTGSPVLGFLPRRAPRSRTRKLPKPRNSIFSPWFNVSMMLSKTISTKRSASFLVSSAARATSSTSSALVMHHLDQNEVRELDVNRVICARLFVAALCFAEAKVGKFAERRHAAARFRGID